MTREEWLATKGEWKRTGRKICTGCLQDKPIGEFQGNGKGRTQARCRPCRLGQTKAWRAANRERYTNKRWEHLLSRYGLKRAEYEAILDKQGGRCAICYGGVSWGRRNFSVDHDHNTHKVRGLLCSSCNTAVGHFKESLPNLQRAIEYLRAHGITWS